jgi:spore germination protein GerM
VRLSQLWWLAVLFCVAIAAAYWYARRPSASRIGDHINIYYCKPDPSLTVVAWPVSLGPARDLKSVAFYAAVQAVAGPPPGTEAIRFPAGTRVRAVEVNGSTADVDLSSDVKPSGGGSFAESGEFKGLVWTLTGLPGITSVRIRIEGARLATLPGGHLELDEPLSRSSW